MDSRQQELSVLRNELLGLSEVVELSPVHEPMKRSSSNVSFETVSFFYYFDFVFLFGFKHCRVNLSITCLYI